MAWLEITIQTTPENLEKTANTLTCAGFSDLVLEDQGEFEAFLEENRACWDYIDEALQQKLQGLSDIKLYLEDTDAPGMARLEALCREQNLPMTTQPLPQADWAEDWKQNYPPVAVGRNLLVVPYWRMEEDTGGRIPIILDPGLTFGTGEHPSTQMVLAELEDLARPGCRCLDLGSGSGILSIAALRLGAGKAVGVDIDPKAEDMARENAGYNGFAAPEFTALTGSVTEDDQLMNRLAGEHWDLVLVNIVADVIIQLAPVLPRFLGPESVLLCSGILDTRLSDVTAALEKAGLEISALRAGEDWRCLRARLSPNA